MVVLSMIKENVTIRIFKEGEVTIIGEIETITIAIITSQLIEK
jgi:hypothetical protein